MLPRAYHREAPEAVRQRPHVLHEVLLRSKHPAEAVAGVVGPQLHRDGPLHHGADTLAPVPPQARHPVLGMPGMAPAGVLALPGPLGGVREGGGAVGTAFLRQRVAEKRRAEDTPTLAEAARRVVEQKRAGWRNSRHPQSWLASLERYAFPRIGNRLICEVTSADVLEILTPIWHDKAQTARRLRQRVRSVLEWAVAMELRVDNPCDRIGPVLGSQQATRCSTCGRCRRSPLVFPAPNGAPLPEKALRRLLQDQRIAVVPHGFRSTFRDWAAEETNHPREVIEAALAHVIQNQVEAAYATIGPVRAAAAADGRMGQRPPPNRIVRQHAR